LNPEISVGDEIISEQISVLEMSIILHEKLNLSDGEVNRKLSEFWSAIHVQDYRLADSYLRAGFKTIYYLGYDDFIHRVAHSLGGEKGEFSSLIVSKQSVGSGITLSYLTDDLNDSGVSLKGRESVNQHLYQKKDLNGNSVHKTTIVNLFGYREPCVMSYNQLCVFVADFVAGIRGDDDQNALRSLQIAVSQHEVAVGGADLTFWYNKVLALEVGRHYDEQRSKIKTAFLTERELFKVNPESTRFISAFSVSADEIDEHEAMRDKFFHINRSGSSAKNYERPSVLFFYKHSDELIDVANRDEIQGYCEGEGFKVLRCEEGADQDEWEDQLVTYFKQVRAVILIGSGSYMDELTKLDSNIRSELAQLDVILRQRKLSKKKTQIEVIPLCLEPERRGEEIPLRFKRFRWYSAEKDDQGNLDLFEIKETLREKLQLLRGVE